MSLKLTKGGNLSLDKAGLPGPTPKFRVALGWDPASVAGVEFDLDAQAIVVDAADKAVTVPMLDAKLQPGEDGPFFVFYNQRGDKAGAVVLSEDDRSGSKVGDDETLDIDLSKIYTGAQKIVFTASIHEATKRGQNFGQVKNAFIRILDSTVTPDPADPKKGELLRYDLSEDASMEAAMIFGELYLKDGAWKFRAVGNGTPGGLEAVARTYGVDLG